MPFHSVFEWGVFVYLIAVCLAVEVLRWQRKFSRKRGLGYAGLIAVTILCLQFPHQGLFLLGAVAIVCPLEALALILSPLTFVFDRS